MKLRGLIDILLYQGFICLKIILSYVDSRIDSSWSCYFGQVNLLVNCIILIIEPLHMLTSELYVLVVGLCNSIMFVGT